MDPITFRSLLPEPGTTDALSLLASLPLERASAEWERPYTLVNFVASVDGQISVNGRSGPLGDEGDRDMFRALRERCDAVLAGTNTMGIERYGRILRDPLRRERRRTAGLSEEPLAVLISRSGRFPLEIPLFAEPEARVVLFSLVEVDVSGCAAQVEVELLAPGTPFLTEAMRILRGRYGVRTLLCEGGPVLFGGLLREGLADELCLTIAPALVGGAGGGTVVASGPPLDGVASLRLLSALEREGSLFLRYGLQP